MTPNPERTQKQLGGDIYREGVADGQSVERSAIVAWLKEQAAGFDALNLVWMGNYLRMRSFEIKRGDHLKDAK